MSDATIYTVGYTGLDPALLATAVKRLNLIVVDTRYSPRSRNPAWNRGALMKLLQTRYTDERTLGNINYKGGPIEIPGLDMGVATVFWRYLNRNKSIVLLCACEHVETCHRKIVADALAQASGCPIVHWTSVDVKRAAEMQSLL